MGLSDIMNKTKTISTKQKIIYALEELMNHRDLDEIYVSDIIRLANISRKTFYRHYQDKYDLVNSYFSEFYYSTFERITLGDKWEDALQAFLSICEDKSVVLIHAYSSKDANCLRKYDIEITEKTYRKYLELKDVDTCSEEMNFAIKIASSGGTDMVIEWLLSGMKKEKHDMVRLIKRTLPQDILNVLS